MTFVETNPLLDFTGLTRFDLVRPEHITPALSSLLAAARRTIDALEQDSVAPTWSDFIEPLETATEHLSRAWKAVEHLNAVADTPELRAVYNENLPKITEFWTAIAQNPELFAKYRALAASPEYQKFSTVRRRVIDHALRDFRLGGAELAEDEKKRFAQIEEELAALGQKFSENVLDATNDYSLVVASDDELDGLPPDAIAAAQVRAEREGLSGYKISLQTPSFLSVLQFSNRREMRHALYEASTKRASEFGPARWDNTEVILQTLALRKEAAHLLGYPNFAEVSLVPKMAQTPEQVLNFLLDMARRARPYGEKDLAQLRQFAETDLGIRVLEAWDMMYASEKLREKLFAFSEQEIKQYFPVPTVLEGLFHLAQTLFSVRIVADSAPVWDPAVCFYRIESHEGSLIAEFYLDLYTRPNKRSGAWMDDARSRRRIGAQLQTPVAFLTCNFSEPVDGKPALMSHDDVTTLFHEFGHGLHHMLTQVEELPVSGIHGVEWDAVELPSQFMENFCWEWEVIGPMTRHVETGERLPRALFDRMLAAKNFHAGLQTLRQIEFALFDMLLHDQFVPGGERTVAQLLDEVRDTVAVVRPPEYNRFPNQFSHIFAGGYAAGYYSYKWAEVLSADAYGKFEEDGVLNPATGARFRDEILAVGGSRPALESFRAFRGRAPSIDALMRHHGMVAPMNLGPEENRR